LNIDYPASGTPVRVKTASGVVKAYLVTLKKVSVGAIELRNIDAVVMEGSQPDHVLLGMSFLSNVEIQRSGNMMRLIKNY
jgi:aspartyl protease family protein